ncbi:MAG: Asp23/Gls24 family envelope stress response protein [Thermoleophilaceae bacterium]|nr:Asp23/Gls24 family envelope stress response protein [Thermoleophilaceae bacterium]
MATEETRERAQGPGGDTTAMRPRATVLVTEQGKTTIADVVVSKIAGIAAREVPGVHELVTQGVGGAVTGLAQRVTGTDTRSQGVNVEVGEREAAVNLRLTVDYGVSIPQVAEAVRRNIMSRLEAMTGLIVKEVNIEVTDLYFPEEEAPPQQIERRVE